MPSEVPDRRSTGESHDEGETFPSDPHSRRVIEYLRETDGPVDVTTLATHVVADFREQPPEEVPNNVQRRVQTWLHHGQLPALDEHGVIEYDSDRGTVELANDSSYRLEDAARGRSS